MCIKALLKQIELGTAVDLALLADMYNAMDLKKAALCFILNNKEHFQAGIYILLNISFV